MKLKIKYVKGKTHNDERVVISVLEDTNMRHYIILDSTFKQDHKISNRDRHPYWFPAKAVSEGDLIVLYTRKGTNSETKNKDNTTHFFYWGLDSNVWNDDGDTAYLMYISSIDSHKVNIQE